MAKVETTPTLLAGIEGKKLHFAKGFESCKDTNMLVVPYKGTDKGKGLLYLYPLRLSNE